ncbi:MAG: hypothetical protein HYU29_00385 [Chloroflexi bacterium]|nr:hypothetical protein [Chloroflexota bacterium]
MGPVEVNGKAERLRLPYRWTVPALLLSALIFLLLGLGCLRGGARRAGLVPQDAMTPAPLAELGVFLGDSWSLAGTLRGTISGEGAWPQGHVYRALRDTGGGDLAFSTLYTLLATEGSGKDLRVRLAQPSIYLRSGGEPLYPRSDYSATVAPVIPPAPEAPPPLLTLDWDQHEESWLGRYSAQMQRLPGVVQAEVKVGRGSVPLRGGLMPTIVFETARTVRDPSARNDYQERSRWEYIASTGVLARWVHEARGTIEGVQVDVALSSAIGFFRRAREP